MRQQILSYFPNFVNYSDIFKNFLDFTAYKTDYFMDFAQYPAQKPKHAAYCFIYQKISDFYENSADRHNVEQHSERRAKHCHKPDHAVVSVI